MIYNGVIVWNEGRGYITVVLVTIPAEVVKVFDGNSSLRRRMFRLVTVSRSATVSEFLMAAMRAFHLPPLEDAKTYLTDAYAVEETELTDPLPVAKLTRRDGKRPAVFLRYRSVPCCARGR